MKRERLIDGVGFAGEESRKRLLAWLGDEGKGKVLMLCGAPHSGKTTLAMRLCEYFDGDEKGFYAINYLSKLDFPAKGKPWEQCSRRFVCFEETGTHEATLAILRNAAEEGMKYRPIYGDSMETAKPRMVAVFSDEEAAEMDEKAMPWAVLVRLQRAEDKNRERDESRDGYKLYTNGEYLTEAIRITLGDYAFGGEEKISREKAARIGYVMKHYRKDGGVDVSGWIPAERFEAEWKAVKNARVVMEW